MNTEQDRSLRELAAKHLSDGDISNAEIMEMLDWMQAQAVQTETTAGLLALLREICADNLITEKERARLRFALQKIWVQADCKEKGNAFEQYVITRFDCGEYRLIEWRSDKKIEGWGWPLSSQWPDLVMASCHDPKKRVAIECKYKSLLMDGDEWAASYQIQHYREYEIEERIPVWVAIGVGGCAALPDVLCLAPLAEMMQPLLTRKHLEKFALRGNVSRLIFDEEAPRP